jgi:hypothetical protein
MSVPFGNQSVPNHTYIHRWSNSGAGVGFESTPGWKKGGRHWVKLSVGDLFSNAMS